MDTASPPLTDRRATPSLSGHVASRPPTDSDRMSIDPTTEEGLRRAGYQGFTTIGALRESALAGVPAQPGVYLVLYPSEEPPRFLQIGRAHV